MHSFHEQNTPSFVSDQLDVIASQNCIVATNLQYLKNKNEALVAKFESHWLSSVLPYVQTKLRGYG